MKLSLISSLSCAGTLMCIGCAGSVSSSTQEVTVDAQVPVHSCGDAGPLVQKQTPNPLLLTNVRIRLIFWGSWWTTSGSTQVNSITEAWNVVGNDPNFYLPMAEYGIHAGTMDGTYNTNWDLPSDSITGDYVLKELSSEIQSRVLPANDPSSLYIILLPSTTHIDTDLTNGWDGWHTYSNGIAYGIVEYHDSYVDTDKTISHEIFEACSDTIGTSGYNGGSGITEIGDLCQGDNYSLDGYTIQTVWSENRCSCVP
jgi:hypothetical protein